MIFTRNQGKMLDFLSRLWKNPRSILGIPAKKTRKPRTSKILTKETRKLLDFLPRKFFDF